MFKYGQRDPEIEKRWRRLIAEQESSGLSQSEFCRRKGLRPSTFNHWKIEIKKRDRESNASAKKAPQMRKSISSPSIFIPVVSKSAQADDADQLMEIVFAGGKYLLRIDTNIDRESLRRIVTALVDIKC